METEICIACGLKTEKVDGPLHKYLVSSPGCWAKFGEVLAREYENPQYMAVHALTVDAYALQHPGYESAQTINSANVHLASLYCFFELGKSIGELSQVKQDLTRYKDQFLWMDPPEEASEITVADVLESESASEHREAVLRWSEYIYGRWEAQYPYIASLPSIEGA
ncbi:MAG: DUF5946 family protein [Acidobacteriota bacterium]